MADFPVPRYVTVVGTITRNRTGRVDKTALRQASLAELETRRAESASF